MYALPCLCRWIPLWLAFLFAAGHLSAAVSITYTDNAGVGGLPRVATATVNFTVTEVAGIPNITGTWYYATNPSFSLGWAYRTKRNGSWNPRVTVSKSNGQELFPATTFPMDGDGFELIRLATAAKPHEDAKFVELFKGADGTATIEFTEVNTGTTAQWYGMTDGLVTFGLTLVPPGGTFKTSITLQEGDPRMFQVVKVDMDPYRMSGDNPAGPNHIIMYDMDGDGVSNGPNDGLVIPNGYLTPVGPIKGYPQGVQSPESLANNAPNMGKATAVGNGSAGGGIPHNVTNSNVGGGVGSGVVGGGLTEGTGSAQLAQINANLVAIQKAIVAQGPNGGGIGGGGDEEITVDVDVSGVETRLDTANASLDVLEENAAAQKAAKDEAPTVAEMQTQGNTAAEGIGELIPVVDQPAAPGVSGSSPSFTVSFPSSMGGGTYDLDPFKPSRFGGLIDWFRSACSWTVIGFFALWASMEVKEWVKASAALPQAKGNAVFGGTGAQLTALAAAGLITVVVGGFLVTLIAWLGGEFAMPALLAALDDSPLAGAPSTAAWMLNRCFPVETMVAAICVRAAWNFFATSIFAVAATAIRFIVP